MSEHEVGRDGAQPPRFRRRMLLLGAGAAGAAAAAGGGYWLLGRNGPVRIGNPGADAAEPDALVNFAACMREHGIDMPDPEVDGELSVPADLDPQSAEFQAAVDACQEHLAGGGVRFRGPGDGPRGVFGR